MQNEPESRLRDLFARLPTASRAVEDRALAAALAALPAAGARHRRPVRTALLVAAAAVCLLALAAGALGAAGALHVSLGGVAPEAAPAARGSTASRLIVPQGARGIAAVVDGRLWFTSRSGLRIEGLPVESAALSPHALYVAAGIGDSLVVMAPDGTRAWSHPAGGRVVGIAWAPSGLRIAYVVRTRRGDAQLRTIEGDGDHDRVLDRAVRSVTPSWRADALAVAYVGAGGRPVVYDFARRAHHVVGEDRTANATRVAFAPQGRSLAVGSTGRLWISGLGRVSTGAGSRRRHRLDGRRCRRRTRGAGWVVGGSRRPRRADRPGRQASRGLRPHHCPRCRRGRSRACRAGQRCGDESRCPGGTQSVDTGGAAGRPRGIDGRHACRSLSTARDLRRTDARTPRMTRSEFLLAAAATLALRRPSATLALVTADTESRVAVVDLDLGVVRTHIATRPGPRSIERVGETAVVAHTVLGEVTLIDNRTLQIRHVLTGLAEPRYTAGSPDGRHAFVTDSGHKDLVTIDVLRGTVVGRLRLSQWPRHLSLARGRADAVGRARHRGRGARRRRRLEPAPPRAARARPPAVPAARRRDRPVRPPRVGHRRRGLAGRRLRPPRRASAAGPSVRRRAAARELHRRARLRDERRRRNAPLLRRVDAATARNDRAPCRVVQRPVRRPPRALAVAERRDALCRRRSRRGVATSSRRGVLARRLPRATLSLGR